MEAKVDKSHYHIRIETNCCETQNNTKTLEMIYTDNKLHNDT